MKAGYRPCEHCGSERTKKVAEVRHEQPGRGPVLDWVRWECRDCGRSSEKHFAPIHVAAVS